MPLIATSHRQSACTYHVRGCTNVNAYNYLASATPGNPLDTSSCIARVAGCMATAAFNYNSLANVNSPSSCTYAVQVRDCL